MDNTSSITYTPSQIYVKTGIEVGDVIFWFGSPKRKTHKVQRNNAPFKKKSLKKFGTKKLKNKQKLQLIWIYENMVKI